MTLSSYGQESGTANPGSKDLTEYFLDSVRIGKNQLFFDPDKIAEINVVKVNGAETHTCYGKIYIKSKDPKSFNFISIPDIEKTYGDSISTPTLFMIDNEFLRDGISTYKIDSAYILNVEVLKSTEIEYLKNNLPALTIVKINLKTKDNIAKANEIHIRGSEKTTEF